MSAAASCVPNNELATYRSGEAGGVDAVGGAAATGEDADVGTSDAELPLSLPDAAPPPMRNDAAAVSACAADELTGPNGRCYLLVATRLDWGAARSACQARGTGWDLVSVRTAADSAFLGDILTFEAWLGASDAETEGTWLWVVNNLPFWSGDGTTGNAIDGAYVNWNTDEPNGVTTDCARALPRSFGSANPDAPWADLGCEALRGSVCELYPAP